MTQELGLTVRRYGSSLDGHGAIDDPEQVISLSAALESMGRLVVLQDGRVRMDIRNVKVNIYFDDDREPHVSEFRGDPDSDEMRIFKAAAEGLKLRDDRRIELRESGIMQTTFYTDHLISLPEEPGVPVSLGQALQRIVSFTDEVRIRIEQNLVEIDYYQKSHHPLALDYWRHTWRGDPEKSEIKKLIRVVQALMHEHERQRVEEPATA